jgi:hypothetical protein
MKEKHGAGEFQVIGLYIHQSLFTYMACMLPLWNVETAIIVISLVAMTRLAIDMDTRSQQANHSLAHVINILCHLVQYDT